MKPANKRECFLNKFLRLLSVLFLVAFAAANMIGCSQSGWSSKGSTPATGANTPPPPVSTSDGFAEDQFTAVELTFGVPVSGLIEHTRDQDWYKVYLNGGETVAFVATGSSAIWLSSGGLTEHGNLSETLQVTRTTAGWVTMYIEDDTYTATPSYEIVANLVATPTQPVPNVYTPPVTVEVVDLKDPWDMNLIRTVGDNADASVLKLKVTANQPNVNLTRLTLGMSLRPDSVTVSTNGWDTVGTGSIAAYSGDIEIEPINGNTSLATLASAGDFVFLTVRANLLDQEGLLTTSGRWLDFTVGGQSNWVPLWGVSDQVDVKETPRAAIAAVSSLTRVYNDKLGEVLAAELDLVNNSTKHALDLRSISLRVDTTNPVGLRLENDINTVLSHAWNNGWFQYNRNYQSFSVDAGDCHLIPGEGVRLRVFLDPAALVNNSVTIEVTGASVVGDNGQSAYLDGVSNNATWQYEALTSTFASNLGGPSEAFAIAQLATGSVAAVGSFIVAKVEVTAPTAGSIHPLQTLKVTMNSNTSTVTRNFRLLVNGVEQATFSLTDWLTPATVTLTGVDIVPGQTLLIELEMEVTPNEAGNTVQMMLWNFQSTSHQDAGQYLGEYTQLW